MSTPEIDEADLQSLVDGRLSEGRCTAVLVYLSQHPDDLQRLAAYARHKEELRDRLEALDQAADDPDTEELERALADRLTRPGYGRWLRRAATVALLLAAGWSSHDMYRTYLDNRVPALVIKAAQAHQVFGEDQRRPVELTAASTQEMAALFSSRLGERVEIPALGDIGLRLIGGRLLAAGDRPIAQLIYEDSSGHRLTLCLSSAPLEAGDEVELVDVGELNAGYWHEGDLTYALVGETPDARLVAIASELGAEEPGHL